MRERRKAENYKKGYTTVELVVVTVIMLILAEYPCCEPGHMVS